MLLALFLLATIPQNVTPNDGLDDAPGIRAAIATACSANGDHLLDMTGVPPGVYDVTQESGKLGSFNVSACAGLTVRCAGDAHVFKQIPRYMDLSNDWYMWNIDNGSSSIEFEGCTIDGARTGFEHVLGNITSIDDTGTGGTVVIDFEVAHGLAVNQYLKIVQTTAWDGRYRVAEVLSATSIRTVEVKAGALETAGKAGAAAEQVHTVRVYNGSKLAFRGTHFKNSFGAAIKAITASEVSVVDSRFTGHARGGFEGHSNVTDVRIVGNRFEAIVDQSISQEGAGGNARWTITGNNFGPPDGGTNLILDMGSGSIDTVLANNTFLDGSVKFYIAERFTVANNTFVTTSTAANSPLILQNKIHQAVVTGNMIISAGTGTEVYGIRTITQSTTGEVSGITITGNIVYHAGSAGIVASLGLGESTITGNTVVSTDAASTSTGIIVTLPVAVAQRGVVVAGNTIKNQATGITVTAIAGSQDDIAITGNVITSTKSGSKGVYNQVWNHSPYSVPYSTACRGDANVIRVTGAKWTTTGTVAPAPTATEGCREHGDAVP